jgi:hypothetical protein
MRFFWFLIGCAVGANAIILGTLAALFLVGPEERARRRTAKTLERAIEAQEQAVEASLDAEYHALGVRRN